MRYRTARIGVDLLDGQGAVLRTITRRDVADWRDYQAWCDAGNVPEPMPPAPAPPTDADEAYKREARRQIDAAAGRARARYITVSPGQDATYIAKYDQAQRYLAAGPAVILSDYPWVEVEAQATGVSGTEAATRIKALGDAWANVIGPAIEGRRIAGKDGIMPLTTRAEVDAHVAQVVAQLGEI